MKVLIVVLLLVGTVDARSQCADVYTDINSNPYVCGTYGDAAGNSNWNWELTDKNDPNWCAMWYARTSSVSTKLTAMGSPFVDATTASLETIAQQQDFTRAKGWELLRRDFGCSHVTAYPYFVLYNRYLGLMRVFVYQPDTQPQYSGILLQIEPSKTPWPATTALGDPEMATTDKFLNGNSAGTYGKVVVAVGEPAGSSRWSMAEFNPGFDPNIANAVYAGTGLKFTIFGVLTFDIKAVAKGKTASSTDPRVYNFNYSPTQQPASNGTTVDFTAIGEKFIKFGKTVTEIRTIVNNTATAVYNSLSNVNLEDKTVEARYKNVAKKAKDLSSSDSEFNKSMGDLSNFLSSFGTIFKFVGGIVGFFSKLNEGPTISSYSAIDMEIQGTITAKSVEETFILRIPGSLQTNNDNAPYFNCPIGLFALKTTPRADRVTYQRLYEHKQIFGSPFTLYQDYHSYKIKNNIAVAFNDAAGLELVAVKAAIGGEILPKSDGTASYNPLAQHLGGPFPGNLNNFSGNYYFNHMLPDFENNRLELTIYDADKGLHTFQTPFVDLGCLNGLTFNVIATTKVYLKVQAMLKRKNDPTNSPIYFVKNFVIETDEATITNQMKSKYQSLNDGFRTLPPYSNITQVPLYWSNRNVEDIIYGTGSLLEADNSITTGDWIQIPATSQNVVFRAGSSITLGAGFEALYGAGFTAGINNYGYTLNCITPDIEAFQYTGNCFNTSVTALRSSVRDSANVVMNEELKDEISIYPVPGNGILSIKGNLIQSTIMVLDQAGKVVHQQKQSTEGVVTLNLQHLPAGIYFIRIISPTGIFTRKAIINK